jgi:hypothetical protein
MYTEKAGVFIGVVVSRSVVNPMVSEMYNNI